MLLIVNVRMVIFLIAAVIFLNITVSYALACTVWGAAGQKVSNKGTIIAKNRDNSPNLVTLPKFYIPKKGFRIFALYDIEADGYVVGGINEKGLAVLNASAFSVPRKKRHVATEDTTERVLKTFASVDAVLSERDMFTKSHPALYMIADSSKIATIEVAPGGKIAIKMTDNGTLYFTNHYTDESLLWANEQHSAGSSCRLKYIHNYLTSSERPFSMNDFIIKSDDRTGGPDYALWRTGSSPRKVRTLASLVISIPMSGLPEVYIKIANPGEPEQVFMEKLDFSLISPEIE